MAVGESGAIHDNPGDDVRPATGAAFDGTVAELALLAALLLFVASLCLQPITESDLFFRLKVGQEIIARGGLPGRNLFSFTAPDHPDLDLSWGFEVALALLYRVGGFKAVVAGKAIWMVGTFAGAFAVCRARGAGALATALVLGLAAVVMRERLVERPHIVSFAGEVVVLAAIAGLDQAWRPRGVAVFAAAMLIWANAHAGVFVGAFMLALAAAALFPVDRSAARRGIVLACVAAAAACATPVGPLGLFRYLLLHLRLPDLHAVDEFRNATWRSDAPFYGWAVAAGFAVVVLALRWARGRHAGSPGADANVIGVARTRAPRWLPDAVVAAGLAVLGFCSVRFSADATLVLAPLLALALRRRQPLRGDSSTAYAVVPLALALSVFAVAWPRWGAVRAGGHAVDVDVDTALLPLQALRFVEQHGLRRRMYNDFEFGSYLLFEGYPRYRVFVDPRLPAYPEDMHRLLGSFDVDRPIWGAAMDRYGVESALLGDAGINRRVAWWDPRDWALVYRADNARVFVRRRDEWRALIAAREIPATFDFTVEQGTTTRPIEDRPPLSPLSDCEWRQRVGDLVVELDHGSVGRARRHYRRALSPPGCLPAAEEARLAAWMGAVDLKVGELDTAVVRLDRALALAPDDTPTRANRATAYQQLGRRAEAAADWTRVAAEARATPLGRAAAARARQLATP